MILDASAIVAVLLDEPHREQLVEAIGQAPACGVGAPTALEAAIVLTARIGPDALTLLERFLDEASVEVIAFGDAHRAEALRAYERFGKGRHRAGLNFGDCMSYAVARLSRRPLLCTGSDFRHTDLDVVKL